MKVLTLLFLMLILFLFACDKSKKTEGRNQLEDVLKDENVKLELRIWIDTTGKWVEFESRAFDHKKNRTYQFPGFAYIDNEFIELIQQGSVIIPATKFGYKGFNKDHLIKIVFPVNDDFNWDTKQVVSAAKDSIQIAFKAEFFRVNKTIKTQDSITFFIDGTADNYKANIEIWEFDDKNELNLISDTVLTKAIHENRFVVSKKEFRMDDSRYYRTRIWVSQENSVLYKGATKGKLVYSYLIGHTNLN